jgi:uncharacterized protein (DUF169 family)
MICCSSNHFRNTKIHRGEKMSQATTLKEILGLQKEPIAIGFLDAAPEGLSQWNGTEVPAGCAFWEKAASGQAFYTVPSDHYNCAVGSYTHKIDLPESRAGELMETLEFMAENNYVAMSEVPGIPTLSKTPAVVAYAPLDQASFKPDVVLLSLKPAQAMIIYEAAVKAGAGNPLTNALGRPACAVLPLTLASEATSISLGCKGNRTFTGLSDDEMYVSIPAEKFTAVMEKLNEAHEANCAMAKFYEEKKAKFASGS